jgi:hypothetical protein
MAVDKDSTRVISHQIDETGVTFVVREVGTLRLSFANLSGAVRDRALAHGLVQRVSDAAAKSRDAVSGKAQSPEVKFAAMKELVDHYMSGTESWALGRESEGQNVGLLVECLSEIYPERNVESIRQWVKLRSAAERKSMLGSEKIKPIAERIEKEKLKHIDAESLLSDLETMPE